MKSILFILLSLLFYTSFAEVTVEDHVYVLTNDNFDEFVNNEAFTVVEFYAPWCGHCKKLTPEYSKAAASLAENDPPIKLAKVDATIEKALGERFQVKGYPTLKIFRNGVASEYSGPRQAAGIVKFVLSKTGPDAISLETDSDVQKFTNNEEPSIVFFGSQKDSEKAKVFYKIASSHRETYRFGHAIHSNTEKIVFYPSNKYQSKLEKGEVVFEDTTSEELIQFIETNIVPLAGEYSSANAHLYRKLKKPVFKVYVEIDWEKNAKGVNYYLNRLRKLAIDNKFQDKLSFVVVNKKSNSRDLAVIGFSEVKDAFFIQQADGDDKYVPAHVSFSPASAKDFIEEFLASKVEVYIKSEPIPTSQDEHVKVAVGKSFRSLVVDESDDVVVLVTSPTSTPSKTFVPKFEELAKKLKKVRTLTFVHINGAANDLPSPYVATTFPTIYIAPANAKDKPIKYTGKLEINDLLKQIRDNVHNPLPTKNKSKDEL